ncbi:MAG: glycine cleavage system aminomethyltransferase GcvT [Actinomycetota bacterium]
MTSSSESTTSSDASTRPSTVDEGVRHTPLHGLHGELGGRLVPFAGWELPIQYEGVIAEHTACRTSAALFDVSHMGIIDLHGAGPDEVAERLETVTPAGITTLAAGRQRYSLLTNDDGGIIDDCIISRYAAHGESGTDGADDERLSLVVNASRRDVDLAHLRSALDGLDMVERLDLALLALQGPAAATALAALAPTANGATPVEEMVFGTNTLIDLKLPDGEVLTGCRAFRSGYTGEDGYELMVPADGAEALARALLADERVTPAGLGARDTLRLEAGLALYGNDLDETTSPVEADLTWTIPKRRREAGGFPGADRVARELLDGPTRLRVGLAAEGRRPVREPSTLTTADGRTVGVVTSGGYGPTVERPVAMGYVSPELADPGTPLLADVRGRPEPVVVADLPFTPHRYFRGA